MLVHCPVYDSFDNLGIYSLFHSTVTAMEECDKKVVRAREEAYTVSKEEEEEAVMAAVKEATMVAKEALEEMEQEEVEEEEEEEEDEPIYEQEVNSEGMDMSPQEHDKDIGWGEMLSTLPSSNRWNSGIMIMYPLLP